MRKSRGGAIRNNQGGGKVKIFGAWIFILIPLVCRIFFSEAQALHVIFVPHISSFVTNLRFQNLVSIVYHLACVAGGIVSTRFKFLRRSRDQKKGVGTRLTPLVAAPPPNLTRLIHSTSKQYRHSASYAGQAMVQSFSSPEPVVSWSRGLETLQIKPSGSGDENGKLSSYMAFLPCKWL